MEVVNLPLWVALFPGWESELHTQRRAEQQWASIPPCFLTADAVWPAALSSFLPAWCYCHPGLNRWTLSQSKSTSSIKAPRKETETLDADSFDLWCIVPPLWRSLPCLFSWKTFIKLNSPKETAALLCFWWMDVLVPDSISSLLLFPQLAELMLLENYPFHLNFRICLHTAFTRSSAFFFFLNLHGASSEDLIYFYGYVDFFAPSLWLTRMVCLLGFVKGTTLTLLLFSTAVLSYISFISAFIFPFFCWILHSLGLYREPSPNLSHWYLTSLKLNLLWFLT